MVTRGQLFWTLFVIQLRFRCIMSNSFSPIFCQMKAGAYISAVVQEMNRVVYRINQYCFCSKAGTVIVSLFKFKL